MSQKIEPHFAGQLGRWAEALITKGRSPLRRVDLHPRLITAEGEMHPTVVFWINRDSLMAGGLICATDPQDGLKLADGRACAQALGLRHFVTWDPAEVTIWESGMGGNNPLRSFGAPPSPRNDSAGQVLMTSVVGELQYLAVAKPLRPGEFDAYYLANLCILTLDEVENDLAEALRIAAVEDRRSPPGMAGLGGRSKALLTLLRLLALLHQDQLPASVRPEGLEHALFFFLDTLPPELRPFLVSDPGEIPLPPGAAIRFHHLLRRLGQLEFGPDRDRCIALIKLLLKHEAPQMGGFPLPADPGSLPEPRLVVNSDSWGKDNPAMEIAAPPLLAHRAILGHLEGRSRPQVQTEDPFTLQGPIRPQGIVGTLTANCPPAADERRMLAARLRGFWPSRRFGLSGVAPRWVWEFLHLAGLVGEDGRLVLRTPGYWLPEPFATPLLQLLRDRFFIEKLHLTEARDLEIHCSKGRTGAATQLSSPTAQRTVEWDWLRQGPLSRFPLALQLPDRLFHLMQNGSLVVPDGTTWPAGVESAIMNFLRTVYGRAFWRLLAGSKPLPPQQRLLPVLLSRGMPIPSVEILRQLQERHPTDARTPGQISRFEGELAQWLGAPIDFLPPAGSRPDTPVPGVSVEGFTALQAELQAEVFSDGIPRFPEQYLYSHYRPTLLEYRFTPPLRPGEEFFGRMVLADADGQRMEVPSLDTALALNLAAAVGKRVVQLPVGPELTGEIVHRYLEDLKALHRQLVRKAHARLPDPGQANRLIRAIWLAANLPSPELFQPSS